MTARASAIIPGRAISDIGKLLSSDDDAFLTLSLDGNKLRLEMENTTVYVILIGGEYVNYRQILPSSFKTTVRVPLAELRSCVDRASLIAREGNNWLIMKIQDGAMAIEAHSQIGDVHEELDIGFEGNELSIAFNSRYLTDIIHNIDGEKICMCFNSNVSPCLIKPVEGNEYKFLVLPVRIFNK